MLRTIRRQLRLVNYYAAPRRKSRSAVVFEQATFIALILCIPAAYVIDRNVARTGSAIGLSGRLVRDRDGVYHAGIIDVDSREVDPIWSLGEPIAEFELVLSSWNHGWPITTSRSSAPARATFKSYDPLVQTSVGLETDEGVRSAIALMMRDRGPRLALGPFQDTVFSWVQGPRVHSPFGWVYASFVWFLLLAAALAGPLFVLQAWRRVHTAAKQIRCAKRKE